MPVKDIDEYLEGQPEAMRRALQRLREVIRETAPEATEVISYSMPAFKYHGILVYFAGWKNHYSLYVATGKLLEHFAEELKDYNLEKGTIQFTPDKPLPEELVRKIVRMRMAENEGKMKKTKP